MTDEPDELDLVYNDLHRAQEKNKQLKALCTRAADALEALGAYNTATESGRETLALIAELREVAK